MNDEKAHMPQADFEVLNPADMSAITGGANKDNNCCQNNGTCRHNGLCTNNSKCISNGRCVNAPVEPPKEN